MIYPIIFVLMPAGISALLPSKNPAENKGAKVFIMWLD
jgi:hypothetical protein